MLFIRNGVLHDERAVTGFVVSQEWHRRYALSTEKVKEVVLRIKIAEAIVSGVHGSTQMFVRGQSHTFPITGQSKFPVKGVDRSPFSKNAVVPVTGQLVLPVTGVDGSPFGERTIVPVTGQSKLPVTGVDGSLFGERDIVPVTG